MSILYEILFRPLFNLLVFLYNTVSFSNIGIAIIVLTIIIKLAFLSLNKKAIVSQKALQDLQPKIKEIQAKYKDNKEEQAKAMMSFYKENKVSPVSGCLPLLIQLPILIALYQVFLKGFDPARLSALYPFVSNPGAINPMFFSLLDLSLPSKILAILAGLAQFWQARMMAPKKPLPGAPKASDEYISQAMSKQMMYFLPVFTIFICWKLPAGLALYWVVTTLFTIIQQYAIMRPVRSNK